MTEYLLRVQIYASSSYAKMKFVNEWNAIYVSLFLRLSLFHFIQYSVV